MAGDKYPGLTAPVPDHRRRVIIPTLLAASHWPDAVSWVTLVTKPEQIIPQWEMSSRPLMLIPVSQVSIVTGVGRRAARGHVDSMSMTQSTFFSHFVDKFKWLQERLVHLLRILRNSTQSHQSIVNAHCYRHRVLVDISFTLVDKLRRYTLKYFYFLTRPETQVNLSGQPALAAAASLTLCGFQGRPGLGWLTSSRQLGRHNTN